MIKIYHINFYNTTYKPSKSLKPFDYGGNRHVIFYSVNLYHKVTQNKFFSLIFFKLDLGEKKPLTLGAYNGKYIIFKRYTKHHLKNS